MTAAGELEQVHPKRVEQARAPRLEQVLSQLYLTLFLRGTSARGLSRNTAPVSVAGKLWKSLLLYAFMGSSAVGWLGKPVFVLALALHSLTFFLLGTFIVASAGNLLFNADENDILLHRPIPPRSLLLAKVGTLVRVSLWLAGALNAVGLLVGLSAKDGGWWFPLVHAGAVVLEALFVAGLVVLSYELCLRWFGRERLDALITFAQVLVAIGSVLMYQAPQLLSRARSAGAGAQSAWVWLAPPAWFAAIDDALAGTGSGSVWLGASVGLAATAGTLWLAFSKLAASYQVGLQQLGEASTRRVSSRGGFVRALVEAPPVRWWLSTPAERVSFRLCIAYLSRDRDTKLRAYPALAYMLIMPAMIIIGSEVSSSFAVFGVAYGGALIGLDALVMVDLFRYSQQYRAADLFHHAPLPSPTLLSRGVRAAVLLLLITPCAALSAGLTFWIEPSWLPLLLPGILTAPVFARFATSRDPVIPLSQSADPAKANQRTNRILIAMGAAGALAGMVTLAWQMGWYRELLLGELPVLVVLYSLFAWGSHEQTWPSLE